MPTLSIFQQLPLHIANSIIWFLVYGHNTRDHFIHVDDEHQTAAWLVLHDTSYSWRLLAHEHFCREADLSISGKTVGKMIRLSHLPCRFEENAEHYRYVRKVAIHIHDVFEQPSEEQSWSFSDAWPEDVVFPSAHLLSVYIEHPFKLSVAQGDTFHSELFSWVAERISTALPKLREADIREIGRIGNTVDQESRLATQKVTTHIFLTILKRVKMLKVWPIEAWLAPNTDYPQCNLELVSIDYNCMHSADLIQFVIPKSALSLETLELNSFPAESIRSFIFKDGKPIAYPRLKRLAIGDCTATDMSEIKVDKSVVLFPSLRYLKWRAYCLFADDTLFRGNHRTLSHLDIGLSTESVNILQRENAFSKDRCPKLCAVTTNLAYESNHEPTTCHMHAGFAARLVSSATRTYRTDIPYSSENVMRIVTANSYAENIQKLALLETKLTLLEIIELLKILPRMTDLLCKFGGVGSGLDTLQEKAIVNRLHTEYYPLSRCLKYWTFSHSSTWLTAAAISTITIAILCPSFIYTTVYSADMEQLLCKIKDAIASGDYDEHVERLESLLCAKYARDV